jgi:3-isopropylmalate/(R)-2-methylmalate dehydratase small subunit
MEPVKGKAWVYGDDINTDVIFPGRYLNITDAQEMAEHAMEDLDTEFRNNVQQGDIVVGGKNFGCGSSREQAATCLKHAGVGAIIAKSFARIYYRNAINLGIPILVSDEAPDKIEKGDELEVDLENGTIKNFTKDETFEVKPLPEFILGIIKDGGLIPNLKKKLGT